MSRRPARVTQADIGRAIKAAAKAGPHMAVEILPDGVIRIAPWAPKRQESGNDGENPWDKD